MFDFKNTVTLKTGLGVRQGNWKCHHSIQRIWLLFDVLLSMALARVVSEIFNVEKYRDLEIPVRGHSRSVASIPISKWRNWAMVNFWGKRKNTRI